jgi:hypothetical protein
MKFSPIKQGRSRKQKMKDEIIQIEIYDKRGKHSEYVVVEKLSETKFRVSENAILNCRLTFGAEFETRINQDGQFEITKIIKDSEFVTRRFMLNGQFNESEYRVLGDEIMRQGGFWQVDFGSIATVNLLKDSKIDLDEIFRIFDFHPTEITDEQ